MSLRKAAEMALETLEAHSVGKDHPEPITKTIQALRQALAQPEQEPVAWGMVKDGLILDVICPEEQAREPGDYTIPLYTAPPKREWVGLTDEEIEEYKWMGQDVIAVIKEVQATLKEKNT